MAQPFDEEIGESPEHIAFRLLEIVMAAERKSIATGIDPDSTAYGRLDWFKKYMGVAANRLQIREILKRHPEIHDEVIRKPIIICGLPRTGTTHLVNIMGADTRFRTMSMWESRQPVPDSMQRPLPPSEQESGRRPKTFTTLVISALRLAPPKWASGIN